jgi:hypothetical protein
MLEAPPKPPGVTRPSRLRRSVSAPAGIVCDAAEAHGSAGAAAVPASSRASSSLAAILHLLQDGEVIQLILKPSLWFILLSTLRFAAAVLILMISAKLLDLHLPGPNLAYQELGIFVLGGRLMWAVLQWMGRWYVLTDMRIVRLAGVFSTDVFDCPLRKVARTRVLRSMRERLTRLGTIEIVPGDESAPAGYWMTIARPLEVHEQIVAAINRAKQPGCW